ncbi:hypothetical protein P618_200503 [Holospora obtusa F1]|uniref:AB hydrolase-1 domain-containing protein n=1 Tax=Holospora obtusa F1 TaxID=1399147 RepID=W6TEP7_HOLOB|nr:alpha/beta fold hydrolase [Holospora obtusa]ETZ07319.1 hypothetical protein P618_200503 [Holospora obtusa F1]
MSSTFMIPGPQGKIEVVYHTTKNSSNVVLLASPHPKWEGLLDHSVIFTIYRSFVRCKFDVLRFNYRGTGKSTGTFSNGEGEISDAESCLNWLSDHYPPKARYWVAGYSFGAWIGMQILMRRPECERFVGVALRPNLYPFDFLAPCPHPGLIVHGTEDAVTPCDLVVRLAYQLSAQKRGKKINLKLVPDGDEKFSIHLRELEDIISQYIEKEMEALEANLSLESVQSVSL